MTTPADYQGNGTWGPQQGVLGLLNPFSRDTGATELLPGNNPLLNNTQVTGVAGQNPATPWPKPTEGTTNYDPTIGKGSQITPAGMTPPGSQTGGPVNKPAQNTGPQQPSGAPNYKSNVQNQTVTYKGQTFKGDGNGGWVLASNGQSGPSEADLNAVYDPTMNYLNQAEANIRTDQPNVLNSAQQAYETAIAELQGNKQTNQNVIDTSTTQSGQQKENALSAARRLYDELRRGYGQRFGGATSAGGAASELASVEQQRQQGSIQQQYGNTMQQINQQQQKINTDYQTGSMKILQSKNDAIAQANRDFQNQLLQITNLRAQTEQQKASAKLDALNTLKNQAFQAQQQALQNQTMLDNYVKQQQTDVQTYAQKLALAGQGSQAAQNLFMQSTSAYPTSNLGVGTQNGQQTNTPTGSITGKTLKGYDSNGQPIYG